MRLARKMALMLLVLTAALSWSGRARAIELCGPESKVLMRSVGISEAQITRLCHKVRRATALLAISITRTENELGYCRVTLALQNNATEYLNALTLTSADGRFDIYRFHNVLPGGTGHASASSRILLACDELDEVGLIFHWPASITIGDHPLNGLRLQRYQPVLLDPALRWNR